MNPTRASGSANRRPTRRVQHRQVTTPTHEPLDRVFSVGGLPSLHFAKQARLSRQVVQRARTHFFEYATAALCASQG